jgi:hypothetical protein
LSFHAARTLKWQRLSGCRWSSYIKSQHQFGVCRICSVISVGLLFQTPKGSQWCTYSENFSRSPCLCCTFTLSGSHWLLSLGHALSAAVSHPLAYRPLSRVICCRIFSARIKVEIYPRPFVHAIGRTVSFSHSLHHTDIHQPPVTTNLNCTHSFICSLSLFPSAIHSPSPCHSSIHSQSLSVIRGATTSTEVPSVTTPRVMA